LVVAQAHLTSLLGGNPSVANVRYQPADVNGDGLVDMIEIPIIGGDVRIAMNTGRNFLPPVAANLPSAAQVGTSLSTELLLEFGLISAQSLDAGIRVTDINADGRSDILLLDRGCNWDQQAQK